MQLAKSRMSRIATWFVHVALIACFVLTLGCGAKSGGDTSLIPGKPIKDAGTSARDAKADGGTTAIVPVDASVGVAEASPFDAKPPPVEAAPPKATLVSISVTPPQATVSPAGKVTLKVTGTYSDSTTLDVTSTAQLTSSDPKIGTVAGSVVTAVSPGKVTIVAVVNGLFAFSNITVGQATVVSITLSPSQLSVYSGSFSGSNLSADALMSDGSHKDVTAEATWSSSDPTTAPVSSSGQVQGLNPGSAKITATVGQVQATVTVQVYGPNLKHLSLVAVPQVAHPGDFVQVDLMATFDNGQVLKVTPAATLESSNPAALKVSSNGNGIAASPGKTTITAKLGDQVVGTIDVVVTTAILQKIEVSPATLSIDYPNQGHLTATGVYSDQSRYDITHVVQWTTSDYGVFSTDQGDGVVTANGVGTATATAYYEVFTGAAQVSVNIGSPTSVDVSDNPITVPNYGGLMLFVYANYADGSSLEVTGKVTWQTDDAAIATVVASENYPANFVAGHAGSTKIRAKIGNMTSADVIVTVQDLALLAIDLSDTHIYSSPGATEDVVATGTFQDGSQSDITRAVVWKTGNPAIATVSSDPNTVGRVTGVSQGTTSLNATLGSVSVTTTITVQ